jgi:hypothetical protein
MAPPPGGCPYDGGYPTDAWWQGRDVCRNCHRPWPPVMPWRTRVAAWLLRQRLPVLAWSWCWATRVSGADRVWLSERDT